MDLRQLEYFVRVAELGSFTRASQALGIAQPALSRQVRQLEVELRHHLLLRNGRGVTPTTAGQLLLEHGRGILHQVARAQEELSNLRGGLTGPVTVGLPPSVASQLTVPLTRAFRQQLPQARLSICVGLSTALLERLGQGGLDVAVLYNARPQPGFDIASLRQETLYLVARRPPGLAEDPPPGPIRLAEVATLPLIVPGTPNAIRMRLESELAALGTPPHVVLEIDGIPAILDLVADGAGHAILPLEAVRRSRQPSQFVVRDIVDPPLRIALFSAVSALRPPSPAQQTTRQLLADLLAQRNTAP